MFLTLQVTGLKPDPRLSVVLQPKEGRLSFPPRKELTQVLWRISIAFDWRSVTENLGHHATIVVEKNNVEQKQLHDKDSASHNSRISSNEDRENGNPCKDGIAPRTR